jgi:hypothetical protein
MKHERPGCVSAFLLTHFILQAAIQESFTFKYLGWISMARGASGVGGDGAFPIGQASGDGAVPRRALRNDGLASQACGARAPAHIAAAIAAHLKLSNWKIKKGPPAGSALGAR